MKFLPNNNYFKITKINFSENGLTDFFESTKENYILTDLEYTKKYYKNRKVLLRIKKGITKTEKKNSLKRDKNNSILQQYMNIIVKDGGKNTIFKNFSKSIENFYFILNDENEEFYKYKNYLILNFLVNNFIEFNDFDYLLKRFLPDYYSIFDMKTIKNKKKGKNLKKYNHEICYIPEAKRLKNLLKIINVYSKSFKNYNLWERLFWVFITLMMDKDKTNLLKRRSFIYKKSIKFFKNNKNK